MSAADRWAHQPAAVRAITDELGGGGRALLWSACGTGKSRIAATAARDLVPGGRVLVLVPTLDLASQMVAAFRGVGGAGRLVVVCSDTEILSADGLELPGTVTTRPDVLAAATGGAGRITVVCTYHSLPVLVAAHARHGLPGWELVVADEAHRTAGRAGQAWSVVHDDVAVPAARRLYMTATPRIAGDADERVSMDDEKVFGRVVFRLSTGEAIRRGLLADFRLLCPIVDWDMLNRLGVDPRDALQSLRVGRTALAPQVLAQQVAVLRAAAEHDIRALLTFHNRNAAARGWAQALPQTWELLPPGERPATIAAWHVHGDQDSGVRRAVLDGLRGGSGEGLRVVSNARVLSEGVDIPSVDGVAFVDARSSVVDIIQIIGRALRTGGRDDKIAKIIVPVLVGPDESPEAVLDGSRFKQLWRVLLALRACDDRVEAALDAERQRLGRAEVDGADATDTSLVPDWLTVTGRRVPDGFAQAIWVRAVRTTTPSWMEFYGAARAYLDQHGHLEIPSSYRTASGLTLGRWLHLQHKDFDELNQERKHLLRALGPWESETDRRWRKGCQAARAWAEHSPAGLHKIPRDWTHGEVRLHTWIVDQRKALTRGQLDRERKERLNEVDPTWFLTVGQILLRAARAFAAEHGHLLPDRDYVAPDGYPLGEALHAKRARSTAEGATSDVAAALTRIGMVWNIKDAALLRGVIAARHHYRAHRTLAVPPGHLCTPDTCGDDYPLGAYLAKRKQSVRDKAASATRIAAKLDAISTSWRPVSATARRARNLELAAAYANKHGHLPRPRGSRLPSPRPEGEDFRQWLSAERVKARKGTIRPDVFTALQGLDPSWLFTPETTADS
ncbi:DEAD/DEAH box helicase [Actinomadura atramentaria]|uniref:DEAD/DEAH box helicase n=1 Tax=Actinomadura atramentaria TaxID=1990 RepID=UPI00146C1610|nr:DEAD/DEAH box helicase [Actinomadura atramentaria]